MIPRDAWLILAESSQSMLQIVHSHTWLMVSLFEYFLYGGEFRFLHLNGTSILDIGVLQDCLHPVFLQH